MSCCCTVHYILLYRHELYSALYPHVPSPLYSGHCILLYSNHCTVYCILLYSHHCAVHCILLYCHHCTVHYIPLYSAHCTVGTTLLPMGTIGASRQTPFQACSVLTEARLEVAWSPTGRGASYLMMPLFEAPVTLHHGIQPVTSQGPQGRVGSVIVASF